MTTAMSNQKAAVDSGQWLLYRYNPERAAQGENPLTTKSSPEEAKVLWHEAQHDAESRFRLYEYLAQRKGDTEPAKAAPSVARPTERRSELRLYRRRRDVAGNVSREEKP
jgi:pyruvate/2-oxoacid:ferredoxin oxidoreductase beta subunit